MKQKLLNLLELQDSFFLSFQLYFKGHRKIHSTMSIICSLCINITCLILSITLTLELINHTKPTVNYAKLTNPLTTNFTWNSKNLLYTIGWRDQYYNYLTDPSIISIIPTYEHMRSIDGKLTQEVVPLDWMNCSSLLPFFEDYGIADRFITTGIYHYNCYNGTSYGDDIIIGGKYGTEFYGNLAFMVTKCRNNSNPQGVTCKTEEEINATIQNGWLQVTYVNSFIDFYNYTHPFKYVTEDYYSKIDIEFHKSVYNYFSGLYWYSENNIIFSDESIEMVATFDRSTSDINHALDDGVVFTIYVCPSFLTEKYYRRYVKIQEIGASIGGFWSGLGLASAIILMYFQLRDMDMQILNSLFIFTADKSQKLKSTWFVPDPSVSYRVRKQLNLYIDWSKQEQGGNENYHVSHGSATPIMNNNMKNIGNFNMNNYRKNEIIPLFNRKHECKQVNKPALRAIDFHNYKVDFGIINTIKILISFFGGYRTIHKQYLFLIREMSKFADFDKINKKWIDIDKIKNALTDNGITTGWERDKKIIMLNMNEEGNNDNYPRTTNTKMKNGAINEFSDNEKSGVEHKIKLKILK